MDKELAELIQMAQQASPVLYESALRKAIWWSSFGKTLGAWLIGGSVVAIGLSAAIDKWRNPYVPSLTFVSSVFGLFAIVLGVVFIVDAIATGVAPELAAFRAIMGK